MSIVFHRVGSSDDIQSVETLAQKIWREHYTPIIGESQVEYMLATFHSKAAIATEIAEKGYRYYLMVQEDRSLGYFAVQAVEQTLFLSKLYLLDSERGNGLGKKAMSYIVNIAKTLGLGNISLTVNKDNLGSIAAYTRFGFVTVGEIVADIGNGYVMDDYKMEMTL